MGRLCRAAGRECGQQGLGEIPVACLCPALGVAQIVAGGQRRRESPRSRFFGLLFLSRRRFSILSLKKRRSVYLQVFASSVQLCITSLRKSSPIIFAGIFFSTTIK